MAFWNKLCGGDCETLNENWLAVNTKKCPKCSVKIQKYKGCMEMSCKNCKFDFCWLCLKSWAPAHTEKTGGFYKLLKFFK